jgi:amidase
VARLRAAGAIVLGKTNLPTLSLDGQSNNPIFGRTNNPWDVTRTPGGSGGGGAAAVAAGLSPLDIGSDYGGSVRLPAHYCGVYAIKATEYRIPRTGYHPSPENPLAISGGAVRQQLGVAGPIARSVADLALTLRLMVGPDAHHIEVTPMPLEALTPPRLSGLRLGWADDFGGLGATADTRAALANLGDELERAGAQITRGVPAGITFPATWELWGALHEINVVSRTTTEVEDQALAAIAARAESEDAILRGMALFRRATLNQYADALAARDSVIRGLELFFNSHDALLCPVAFGPAFPHRPTGSPIGYDDVQVPYWMGLFGYTTPFNVTGHPAVAIPLARTAAGLPIGLQIVGRRWGDMQVLGIAAAVGEVIGPYQPAEGYSYPSPIGIAGDPRNFTADEAL